MFESVRVKMRTWMLLEFLGDILYHKRREIVINPVYHNVQWMILALHSCVLQLFLKMIFCYIWIHNRFISIQAWKCVIVKEVWYTLYENYSDHTIYYLHRMDYQNWPNFLQNKQVKVKHILWHLFLSIQYIGTDDNRPYW